MQAKDRNDFAATMAVLAEAFGETPTGNRMDVYFEMLSEYSIDEIRIATKKLLKSCSFFPKIAQFIEAIEGDPESKSNNAWYEYEKHIDAYKTLDIGDPVAHQVIKDMNLYGMGLETHGYPDTRKDYDFIRQEFMKRYRAVSKTADRSKLPVALPGIYEQENARKLALGEDRNWTEGQKSLAQPGRDLATHHQCRGEK